MEHETTSTYTFRAKDIVNQLKLNGEIIGFNTPSKNQPKGEPSERRLIIRLRHSENKNG